MSSPDIPEMHRAVLAAVTEGLPDEAVVSNASLGRIKGDLKRELGPLGVALPDGAELHIDRYSLPAAMTCPASAERDLFEWSAPLAARSIGLPALSALFRGPDHDPLEAVERSIEEAITDAKSLGTWLAELGPDERATTAGAAATWAARAWVAVPWAALGTVHFGIDPIYQRPVGFGSPIVIRGRPDADVGLRRGRVTERVLLILGRYDPVVAGLDALTFALKAGRAPLRVVAVHPASGVVDAVDVDVPLLDQVVADVLGVVPALAPLAAGEPAVTRPGRQCWSCDRRADCGDGERWMQAQPRRVGGIPVID